MMSSSILEGNGSKTAASSRGRTKRRRLECSKNMKITRFFQKVRSPGDGEDEEVTG